MKWNKPKQGQFDPDTSPCPSCRKQFTLELIQVRPDSMTTEGIVRQFGWYEYLCVECEVRVRWVPSKRGLGVPWMYPRTWTAVWA